MSDSKQFKYANVIVTYNRAKKLEGAIESLLSQSLKPQQIIVINNASTDDTSNLLKEKYRNNKRVTVFNLSENMGGSYGFYYGLKQSLSIKDISWVAISDDDVAYEADFFQKIYEAAQQHPQVKCFTGSVIKMDHSIDIGHRTKLINKWNLQLQSIPLSEYHHDFYCDAFTFVGVVFNVDLIRQVGLPNKDFFIRCDDTEYSLRVNKLTKILNVSDARINHLSTDTVENSKHMYTYDWRQYYTVRNDIVARFELTTNKTITFFYVLSHVIKIFVGVFVKPKYKDHRLQEFKLRFDAVKDAFGHNMGKNTKYLP